MTPVKPTKTLADYLVIAVSPALIMVLVHSLCFFLVDIFYRGEAIGGVRWVLFWFVLAVVLIARVGVEQGETAATLYGVALALVTWIYLATVQPNVIFGAVLLAIVWFTAHKLTLNCTLIDDEADASGQGLMQSVKRLPDLFKKAKRPDAKITALPSAQPTVPKSPKKAKARSTQTPGVWLIYYSLAALPVFGLGQTLLPADDLAARHRGVVYLFFYLAAALGLLVTTSFLGLRRYLRQRYLTMPRNIAYGWVKFGVIAAAIVLCLALLLPRPGAGAAWTTLRYHIDYQLHRASNFAARFSPHGTGSGRAGNQSSADGKQENKSAQPDQKPGADQNKDAGKGAAGDGQQSGGAPKSDGTTGQSGGKTQGEPESGPPPAANTLFSIARILFWLAVVTALIWLLYRYRTPILTALKSAWAAIRDFIAKLLGLVRPATPKPPATPNLAGIPPFDTFKNPFLTGNDQVWPPEKLIIYSYNALQSRALKQQPKQGLPQTPREFCRQLSVEMPDATDELEHLAFLYGHVAYGVSVPASYDPERLRQLWNKMSSVAQPAMR